jgi:predicted dehydrogenase
VVGEGGADVTFAGQMRFPHDIFAQFDSSLISPSRSFMEIIGSEGVLFVPTPYKPTRREELLLRRGDRTETLEVKGAGLYDGEVEDMEDAVLLGKSPRISLSDSRGNVAAIVGLLESAEHR